VDLELTDIYLFYYLLRKTSRNEDKYYEHQNNLKSLEKLVEELEYSNNRVYNTCKIKNLL
jgi:hypothetical protein